MMKVFLEALRRTQELRFDGGMWELDGLSLDRERVDAIWPEVELALRADPSIVDSLDTVTFRGDGWYESAPFLASFAKLEQLVLYGTTLLSDLGVLAGHPELRRVAFTNYCGLYPSSGGLDWLGELPRLEELVLFERYLELDGWEPSTQMLSRLRSLWINWSDLVKIQHDALSQLEVLSIYVLDIDEFLGAENDEDEDRSRDEALHASLLPLGRKPGLRLRLLFEQTESAERRQQVDAVVGRSLPQGVRVEHYWEGQVMPLLNDGYGFVGKG